MASRAKTTKTKPKLVATGSDDAWPLVRFGDVVRDVKAKIDRETTELKRYVAGEHMDSDDIHLRRWGELNGDYLGPAFHRGFRKGQVLYGSRRTYLKKVAVAPFDGICANTTFVLESRDSDTLLPELLPFIMLTDAFTQHSIRESKGSVNPYVNWKDIAKYEFPLPPKDEQRRIAEILLAADNMLQMHLAVRDAAELLTESLAAEFLRLDWPSVPCDQLFTEGPRNGLSPNCNADERGYPTLAIGAVREGRIIAEGNIKYAEISESDLDRFRLRRGDVLVVRGNGNRHLCGRCGVVDLPPENCFYPDLLIRLSFDAERIDPEFAAIQWNTREVHAVTVHTLA